VWCRFDAKRFQGGLVFKAHRLVYHSTLGLKVIKKKVYGVGLRVYDGAACLPHVRPLHLKDGIS